MPFTRKTASLLSEICLWHPQAGRTQHVDAWLTLAMATHLLCSRNAQGCSIHTGRYLEHSQDGTWSTATPLPHWYAVCRETATTYATYATYATAIHAHWYPHHFEFWVYRLAETYTYLQHTQAAVGYCRSSAEQQGRTPLDSQRRHGDGVATARCVHHDTFQALRACLSLQPLTGTIWQEFYMQYPRSIAHFTVPFATWNLSEGTGSCITAAAAATTAKYPAPGQRAAATAGS